MTTPIQTSDQFLIQSLSEKLSAEAVTALLEYPTIAAELLPVLDQPPFAADYVPHEIEVLFDDVTVVVWRDGRLQSQPLVIDSTYQPDLVEWVIDGETGYFSIQGTTLVNRMADLPLLNDDVLESLKEDLCKQL